MSDSESSELTDSQMEYEEEEEKNSSSMSENVESESDNPKSEEESAMSETEETLDRSDKRLKEAFLEDDANEDEELLESEDEEDKQLNEEELKRLYLDDFSSDDEEAGNTVGNIPMKWYEKYDHIGYDLNGEKIAKPKEMDTIDKYLRSHDKNERWTIYDEKNGKEIKLTPREIEIIKNIQGHRYAHPGYNDETEYIPYFSGEVSEMPWSAVNPVKASFIPSKWERKKVDEIMKQMKNGTYKKHVKEEKEFYEMWENENAEEKKNAPPNLVAPKMPLPDHSESYNPPEEYLLNDEEKKEWEAKEEAERDKNYLPQKYSCLRRVPVYISCC